MPQMTSNTNLNAKTTHYIFNMHQINLIHNLNIISYKSCHPKKVLSVSPSLSSDWTKPSCHQCDPREWSAHHPGLYFGRNRLGSRQGTDIQIASSHFLLLLVAPDHLGCKLLYAQQAIFQQPGCHSNLRHLRNVLERSCSGPLALGLLWGWSDG